MSLCTARPGSDLDLEALIEQVECATKIGGATGREASIPDSVEVKLVPRQSKVKAGERLELDVVLSNRGGAPADCIIALVPEFHGSIGSSARAVPKSILPLQLTAHDSSGRSVDTPPPEPGKASVVGMSGFEGSGAGGQRPEAGAIRVQIEPGARAIATLSWQAVGYDQDRPPPKAPAGPARRSPGLYGSPAPRRSSLSPGRYSLRLDFESAGANPGGSPAPSRSLEAEVEVTSQ